MIKWIDVFTRLEYRDILIESLKYCQKEKGLLIHSWVIMSNHVHFIFSAKEGFELSNILRDFKKHTSSKIIRAIENNRSESRREWMVELFREAGSKNSHNDCYQFWQQDNKPIEQSSKLMIDSRLDYINNNPVVAGIVEKAEEYVYSSAIDYYWGKGLLDIEYLG